MSDRKQEIALQAAKILLDTKSVLFNAHEPFAYTSGKRGPVYIDCRRLISFAQERAALMDFAAEVIGQSIGTEKIDYIAGGETAGIPYAAFIAERLKKPMVYVRKKPKGFGRMAQIEGHIGQDGARLLLVEDIQNFGASVKIFVDAIRNAGHKVNDLLVLFSYGHASSAAAMKEMDVTLHALTSWKEVLEVARDRNYLDKETLSSVEAFLHNPDQWEKDNADKITKSAL